MASLLACCACEAFSCCVGMSFKVCGTTIPFVKSVGTRLAYVLLFGLTVIVAWVFSAYASQIFKWVPMLDVCKYDQLCMGTMVVYRVTGALFVFHALLALLMIGVKNTKDPRAMVQDGFWGVKAVVLVALTVGAFLIPYEFYVGWAWVDLVAAGVFIVCQLILLVDFAHGWAESWARKYEESEARIWFVALLTCSSTMYLAALGGSIVMYVLFMKDYTLNPLFVTLNLVMVVLYTVLSVHPRIQDANNHRSGLLQASLVAAYSTYLVFSALMSVHEVTGKSSSSSSSSSSTDAPEVSTPGNAVSVALGAVFAVLSVCYSAFTASGSSETYSFHSADNAAASNSAADAESATLLEKKADEAEEHDGDDEHHEVTYNYTFFHVVFATGAAYVCMLLTAWSVFSGVTSAGMVQADSGMGAMWIKIVSSWLCVALYIWTVVAPSLFPNREWN